MRQRSGPCGKWAPAIRARAASSSAFSGPMTNISVGSACAQHGRTAASPLNRIGSSGRTRSRKRSERREMGNSVPSGVGARTMSIRQYWRAPARRLQGERDAPRGAGASARCATVRRLIRRIRHTAASRTRPPWPPHATSLRHLRAGWCARCHGRVRCGSSGSMARLGDRCHAPIRLKSGNRRRAVIGHRSQNEPTASQPIVHPGTPS